MMTWTVPVVCPAKAAIRPLASSKMMALLSAPPALADGPCAVTRSSGSGSWIDLERGVLTIPPSAEKTGRVHDELRRAGLPPQAVALLAEQRSALFAEGIRSEYVFGTSAGERPHPDSFKPILYRLRGRRSNGWPPSKDKRAKQRNAVLPDDVNLHDIRRTVADALLNRIGAPPWIVDHVVLGHARPKLLRTYMPTLPLGDPRDGLERWGRELAAILEPAGDLRRAPALPAALGQEHEGLQA